MIATITKSCTISCTWCCLSLSATFLLNNQLNIPQPGTSKIVIIHHRMAIKKNTTKNSGAQKKGFAPSWQFKGKYGENRNKRNPAPKTPAMSTYNGWKKRENSCDFMAYFLLFYCLFHLKSKAANASRMSLRAIAKQSPALEGLHP